MPAAARSAAREKGVAMLCDLSCLEDGAPACGCRAEESAAAAAKPHSEKLRAAPA